MDAKNIVEAQIKIADSYIAEATANFSEWDTRIRRESHDACKLLNTLGGASLRCHAENISVFAGQMAKAASDLQSAQDLRLCLENILADLNG